MLCRAPIREIKRTNLSRRYAYSVVVMLHYPRGVARHQIDEYVHALAPPRELFADFKAKDRELKDHERAFAEVNYEARFSLSAEGAEQLRRLSALAKDRDVFLLCQCLAPEHCHADLLLLLARHWFQARTQIIWVKYPLFEARLARGELPFPELP